MGLVWTVGPAAPCSSLMEKCALQALSPVKGTITEMTHSHNGPFLLSTYTELTPTASSTVSATKAECDTSLFLLLLLSLPSLCFFSSAFRWCGVSLAMQQVPSRPSGNTSLETSTKPQCSAGLHQHTPTLQSVQNQRNFRAFQKTNLHT